MMGLFRRASTLIAAGLVFGSAVAVPARGAPEPTTLAVEGTLKVTVIETFGAHADGDHDPDLLHTVVTDDGAEIPVELPDDAPANGRFDGELIVEGDVESALDDRQLLPPDGTTIPQDTRAGRVAVAAAETESTPLVVAASTVDPAPAPAISQAATASAHRAYVVKMTDQGSVDGTNATIGAKIDDMLAYWMAEAGGAITSFTRQGAIVDHDFAANIPISQGCGLMNPFTIWDEAESLFPGVDLSSRSSGNHLIVLVGDECGSAGPVGVATIGASLASGGPSMLTYDPQTFASTAVHELGHNVGLEHANLDSCPVTNRCEYYDLYSPMALSVGGVAFTPPALGTLYRAELGLTTPSEIATVVTSTGPSTQSFSLAPRGTTSGLRGLRVTDPATGTTYSIDWRSHTARDASTFYGNTMGYAFGSPSPLYPSGIVIERQDGTGKTYLMTRTAGGRQTGSFAAGTVFTSSSSLSVTVTSIGATADVTVQLNGAPGPTLPPPSPVDSATAPLSTLVGTTPAIRGTAKVGRTLKVRLGSWTPSPSLRYQWFANGRKISSKATRSTFKITSKQKGKRITVRVTGSKTGFASLTKSSRSTKKVVR